ncbi:MAG: hypothetical protein J6Y77_06030 [Paludibacteraceae bacterium]|nr:hypothetical protein [Paludibacteraceae bacterium]
MKKAVYVYTLVSCLTIACSLLGNTINTSYIGLCSPGILATFILLFFILKALTIKRIVLTSIFLLMFLEINFWLVPTVVMFGSFKECSYLEGMFFRGAANLNVFGYDSPIWSVIINWLLLIEKLIFIAYLIIQYKKLPKAKGAADI